MINEELISWSTRNLYEILQNNISIMIFSLFITFFCNWHKLERVINLYANGRVKVPYKMFSSKLPISFLDSKANFSLSKNPPFWKKNGDFFRSSKHNMGKGSNWSSYPVHWPWYIAQTIKECFLRGNLSKKSSQTLLWKHKVTLKTYYTRKRK